MRVTITKQFDGCENGALHPRKIAVGEILEGRLAEVALAEGWGHEFADIASVEIPDDWQTFNAAKSVALAQALGAGDPVKTKAAAAEFIAAEVARRGVAE